MKFSEPTELHRKSGMWGTPATVEGIESEVAFYSDLWSVARIEPKKRDAASSLYECNI
jgi:hypothetical protein